MVVGTSRVLTEVIKYSEDNNKSQEIGSRNLEYHRVLGSSSLLWILELVIRKGAAKLALGLEHDMYRSYQDFSFKC